MKTIGRSSIHKVPSHLFIQVSTRIERARVLCQSYDRLSIIDRHSANEEWSRHVAYVRKLSRGRPHVSQALKHLVPANRTCACVMLIVWQAVNNRSTFSEWGAISSRGDGRVCEKVSHGGRPHDSQALKHLVVIWSNSHEACNLDTCATAWASVQMRCCTEFTITVNPRLIG